MALLLDSLDRSVADVSVHVDDDKENCAYPARGDFERGAVANTPKGKRKGESSPQQRMQASPLIDAPLKRPGSAKRRPDRPFAASKVLFNSDGTESSAPAHPIVDARSTLNNAMLVLALENQTEHRRPMTPNPSPRGHGHDHAIEAAHRPFTPSRRGSKGAANIGFIDAPLTAVDRTPVHSAAIDPFAMQGFSPCETQRIFPSTRPEHRRSSQRRPRATRRLRPLRFTARPSSSLLPTLTRLCRPSIAAAARAHVATWQRPRWPKLLPPPLPPTSVRPSRPVRAGAAGPCHTISSRSTASRRSALWLASRQVWPGFHTRTTLAKSHGRPSSTEPCFQAWKSSTWPRPRL
jgi:hypothetical protein